VALEDSLRDVTHVFFDVGGTILRPEPGAAEVFRRALARRGHAIDRETLRRLLRTPERLVNLISPVGQERRVEYYRHVNARVLEHLGFDSEDPLLDEIRDAFDSVQWRPYPETLSVLKELRAAGYALGIVSNADERLPEVLARCRVAEFFDTVTFSMEVGHEKPDPRIFRRAVAHAGAIPERSLHVGDDYDADYLGARRAGLHALIIVRSGEPPGPCPHVRSLTEVCGLLPTPRSRV